MLVCVREFEKSELSARYRNLTTTQHFERYYSLYATESSVTIVDVADSRARKTLSYDVLTRSSSQLYDQIVEPLLMTVLTPNRAPQAVVVIDGQSAHRRCTLLDPVEGMLTRTVRASVSHPDVISVSVSAVTLEDNNTLTDMMPEPSCNVAAEQPTILEDTHEQFTSVEVTHYVVLDSQATWNGVLHRITTAFAELKHQVVTLIFAFHESTGLPNTTMQFVSFAVHEVARGMKSSRHAISSAAALVECRSPTVTFTATKLVYLLKPTLLGQQPGAWVACFSPVSLLEASEHESFQEAFSVAQTAARLYSSRIALFNACVPPQDRGRVEPMTATGSVGGCAVENAQALPVEPGAADTDASYCASANPRGVDRPDTSALQHHLVYTPGVMEGRAAESASGCAASSLGTAVQNESRGLNESCAVQTKPDAHAAFELQESIQRGGSEKRLATQYELGTYCSVMERALAKLRAEMRDAREQVRQEKMKRRELQLDLERMRSRYDAAVDENHRLFRELRTHRDAAKSEQRAGLPCIPSTPTGQQSQHQPQQEHPLVTRKEDGHEAHILRSDLALLEARVMGLTELVAFHQKEIQEHVAHERSYRQRILDLESEVHERERESIADKAALKELRRAAEAARTAATAAPVSMRAADTSHEIAQRDLRGVEERAAELECNLRDALEALQSERTRRLQLEHLMVSREEEGVARAASEQADALARNLQHTYEAQLRELRAEMSVLRTELAKSGTQSFVQRNLGDTSSYAATPTSRQGRDDTIAVDSQRPTPARTSPVPTPFPTHFSEAHKETSVNNHRSAKAATVLSYQRRPLSMQSFEEFMREKPHYQLHRASLLSRRPRPPVM
ncbi:hypothetical protein JKF63_04520 [Porcisia hertigi]|uniref:Kinesin n=1 Tax=Porcisia hertigi TaxID=2761500 RepID=A0A836ITI3_9TRYP|nr:hypothetical protein JKF63_04520 [Porcisia hertigi]